MRRLTSCSSSIVSTTDLLPHQATLNEAAWESARVTKTGFLVNYEDMPQVLTSRAIQDHLGLEITPEGEKNIDDQFSVYSKRMLRKSTKEAMDDSVEKTESASPEILAAAALYMNDSFNRLNMVNAYRDSKNAEVSLDESPVERVLTTRSVAIDSDPPAYQYQYVYDPITLLEQGRQRRMALSDACPKLADFAAANPICCPGGGTAPLAITRALSAGSVAVNCFVSYNPNCGGSNAVFFGSGGGSAAWSEVNWGITLGGVLTVDESPFGDSCPVSSPEPSIEPSTAPSEAPSSEPPTPTPPTPMPKP
jgi:hypothetical protein